jgi:arylsulfatase A-like enzyme
MWNRKRMRRLVGLAVLVGLACGTAEERIESGSAAASEGPNVILILADDLATSLTSFMPHTEKLLVKEGTSFSSFYVNDPICCPSRGTIMLGEYRQNHELEKHEKGCSHRFFEEGKHRRSLGKLVDDAGYRTGYIGKYLNSYGRYMAQVGASEGDDHLLLGWDDYHVVVNRRYLGFRLHENGQLRKVPAEPAQYQTDVLSRIAGEFIAVSAAKGEPFFLFIAPDAPHVPITPAERHRELFQDTRAPRVPSFNEEDVSGQPGLQRAEVLTETELYDIDNRFRGQARMLQAVDELLRDLVERLEALELLESTYLLFTSDNGHHYGEHRIFSGKGTPFEESVRVPLVIRGPGVVKDRVLSQLATNADLLPTVLDLVGGKLGDRVDGRSLMPLFGPRAADVPWRNALVLESHPHESFQVDRVRVRRPRLVRPRRRPPRVDERPRQSERCHREGAVGVVARSSRLLRSLVP